MTTQSYRRQYRHGGRAGSPPSLNDRLMEEVTSDLRARRRSEDTSATATRRNFLSSDLEGNMTVDRNLEAFLHHPSVPSPEDAAIPREAIDSWFNGLQTDAENAGIPMPSQTVVDEAKRIVFGLSRDLPHDTDVYTLEEGKIVVEVFGSNGRGFQLICEPNGSALCLVTEGNASRRARYENSVVLPDGFIREGLRAVRPNG